MQYGLAWWWLKSMVLLEFQVWPLSFPFAPFWPQSTDWTYLIITIIVSKPPLPMASRKQRQKKRSSVPTIRTCGNFTEWHREKCGSNWGSELEQTWGQDQEKVKQILGGPRTKILPALYACWEEPAGMVENLRPFIPECLALRKPLRTLMNWG